MTPRNEDTALQSQIIKITNSEKKFPDFFNISKHCCNSMLKDFMLVTDIFLKICKMNEKKFAYIQLF